MSFWNEWFKRFGRRPSVFGDIDRMIEEMEKEMAEVFKDMENTVPEDMYRERRLPDGSVRREYGPFIYGYSVKIGQDGKPTIREFGNMKPGLTGVGGAPLDLTERREPLVDIIEDGDTLNVLAELPGVEKRDIRLKATDHSLTINVDNPTRKYYKELEFPVEVDKKSAKSHYANGVLEIFFRKKRRDSFGTEIRIE